MSQLTMLQSPGRRMQLYNASPAVPAAERRNRLSQFGPQEPRKGPRQAPSPLRRAPAFSETTLYLAACYRTRSIASRAQRLLVQAPPGRRGKTEAQLRSFEV